MASVSFIEFPKPVKDPALGGEPARCTGRRYDGSGTRPAGSWRRRHRSFQLAGGDQTGEWRRARLGCGSGDNLDVTYEDSDAGSEDEVVDHVVTTLAQDAGVLRCRHGDRLLVLYARGVAAVEVAPRGAVL